MNKVLSLFMLLALALTMIGLPEAHASMERRVTRKAMKSSMSVQISFYGNWVTIGSGVLTITNSSLMENKRSYSILTAEHVADVMELGLPTRACSVKYTDSCVYLSDYIASSDWGWGSDWAIFPIREKPKKMRPALVRESPMKLGEKVVVVGHPWGEFFVSTGIFSANKIDWNGDSYYGIHSFAAPGNSGGPVFDKRGRLIGLVVAMEIKPNVVTGLPEMQQDIISVCPATNIGI